MEEQVLTIVKISGKLGMSLCNPFQVNPMTNGFSHGSPLHKNQLKNYLKNVQESSKIVL